VGEKRVKLELERQGVQSYYQLALPAETARYVFRALAAKLILSNPEKYGFHIQEGQLYQQKEADLVEVRVRRGLFVKEIAEASGSFYREIMELNPAIVKDYIPTGFYMIRLPKGAATQFFANNPKLLMRMAHRDQTNSMVQYRVKEGDTLMHIAQRFGVSVNSLKQWNEAARKRYLYPGETLVIYEKGSVP
jgi:membrane-bound lytic murein transglycosylase D